MPRFLKVAFALFVLFLLLSIASGIHRLGSDEGDSKTGNIAVIEVTGVITESLPILEQIEEARKESDIKAFVVRVDSPGGAVGASQEIYMELKKLRKTHPVIVSMGDLAASGGLYVSIAGDSIVALPGTLTGSMGVLMEVTNLARLMQKIYIDPVTIRSGDLKDAGNPLHPMDPKAKAYFQELIGKTFQAFRAAVKEERKLSEENLKILGDGRVVNGEDALKLKLVDQLGTFQDAVNLAKDKGKVSGDVKLAYFSRKPKGLLERVLHGAISESGLLKTLLSTKATFLEYRFDPTRSVH